MTAYAGDLLVHLASFTALVARVRAGGPGAFERTARDLHVDRSVLRRRMQTLEAWVGTALFRGRGARLAPTAAGERLLARADRLLGLAQEIPEDVARARARLTIACTGTITTELVPRVLADLERREPRVVLAVRRAGGSACERMVQDGEVDLGVVRAENPPAGLASKYLASDRLWLVLPRAHPLAYARAPSPAEMARVPLVLYGAASRTRARVMDRLGPLGAEIRVEVDGKAAALEYVRLGLGAAFVSLLPGQEPAPGLAARDVTAMFAPSRFHVIAQPERWNEPLTRAAVELFVRHARVTSSRRSQSRTRAGRRGSPA